MACHLRAQRARRGWRPWILFGIASLFYFYEFFARVAPGVLQSELTQASGAGGGGLWLGHEHVFPGLRPGPAAGGPTA